MAKASAAVSLPQFLLNAFYTNDRINQYMLENLPPDAWRAETRSRDVAEGGGQGEQDSCNWIAAR
jgi:hypothetical protein